MKPRVIPSPDYGRGIQNRPQMLEKPSVFPSLIHGGDPIEERLSTFSATCESAPEPAWKHLTLRVLHETPGPRMMNSPLGN